MFSSREPGQESSLRPPQINFRHWILGTALKSVMRFRPFAISLARVTTAAYATFLGLNAQAASPPEAPRGVEAAFGNTVKALYPDGKHQRIWLNPDGTWKAIGRRGTSSSGKWTHKGEHVCLRQARPFPVPFSYCTTFPADGGVGAVWASKDMRGEPIKLTVIPGIER